MTYLKDGNGKTYAMPSHIVEDFEISNVRVEEMSPIRSSFAPNLARLDTLLASIELDVSVGELASILGLKGVGNSTSSLPSTLCGGLPGDNSTREMATFGLCGGLLETRAFANRGEGGMQPVLSALCGGLPGSDSRSAGGIHREALHRFFSDPRLQGTRLRLKADQLNAYLYGE
jgi:hypothetical protein